MSKIAFSSMFTDVTPSPALRGKVDGAMAVAAAILSGRRIGLRQRWLMQESIDAPQMGGIVRLTSFILKTTLAVEGVGSVLLALRFVPEYHLAKGLWFAVFHAVSAFCNAGFDLMGERGPFSSLTGYASDPLVCLTIMCPRGVRFAG